MTKVALRFGCTKQSKNLKWYLLLKSQESWKTTKLFLRSTITFYAGTEKLVKTEEATKIILHKAKVSRKLMKECAQNFSWGENRKWLLCRENSWKYNRQLNCGIAIPFLQVKFEMVWSMNIARNTLTDFCLNLCTLYISADYPHHITL